jgi:hypothetical protein
MTVNTQSLASILRQGLAVLGVLFGVLTQSIGGLHLPVAISSVLAIGGAVILAIEHYVGDTSTGTPTVPTTTAQGVVNVPVAAAPPPPPVA